jgi:hypothetical protein
LLCNQLNFIKRSFLIVVTGASSFAARTLLRREPRRVVLRDPIDGLAELKAQLLPWCEQQGIITELRWWSKDTAAALPDLYEIQWLIQGDTVRAESLLQANSAAAVRRNILAIQQLLEALPESGVPLVLLSSHLAAQRLGVAGSSLAATEALVAQWAASHLSCFVQVWRLPAVFDPRATSTTMASEPSAAWSRERLAEALIDQLFGSVSAVPCQQLIAADPAPSVDQPLLRSQALADAVEWPSQSINAWLARLAEPLDRYGNQAVSDALRRLWT